VNRSSGALPQVGCAPNVASAGRLHEYCANVCRLMYVKSYFPAASFQHVALLGVGWTCSPSELPFQEGFLFRKAVQSHFRKTTMC